MPADMGRFKIGVFRAASPTKGKVLASVHFITRTLQRVVKPHIGNCPIIGQVLETSNNPYYRRILPFKFNSKCICHCGEKACILRYLLICILLVETYRS